MATVEKVSIYVIDDVAGTTSHGSNLITTAGKALLDDADATAQRTTLGLGSVSNTADADKPISTATQAALDAKAASTHATAHKSGGSDAIKLDELAAPTDVTTLNATTSAHGLMQKYPGGTSNFLRADGSFAAPTAAAADPSYSPGSFTVVTETGRYIPVRLKLTGTQRATIEGTGRLVIT